MDLASKISNKAITATTFASKSIIAEKTTVEINSAAPTLTNLETKKFVAEE